MGQVCQLSQMTTMARLESLKVHTSRTKPLCRSNSWRSAAGAEVSARDQLDGCQNCDGLNQQQSH
jgi:hypothetical protein